MAETSNKDLTFSSEVRSYNPEEHSIISYISTKNPDYIGDTVDPKGLELKRLPNGQPKKPVVLWNHNDNIPAVGKCLWIKEDGEGLLAKTQFANTELGRDLEYLYGNEFITDFSIRLMFDKNGIEENETGGFHFKSYNSPEYSFTNIGMNCEAISKSMNEIENKIESAEIKSVFKSYKERMLMEDKIKSLEIENKDLKTSNKDMTSDIEDMKAQIADLTTRVVELEQAEEDSETPEQKATDDEGKSISIEDFEAMRKKIFSTN